MLEMTKQADILEIPKGIDLVSDASRSFWSNAKWRTLFCLIETNGHLPITEMASCVGLTVTDTVAALEGLEKIDLINKSAKGYEQTHSFIRRNKSDFRSHFEIISDYLLSSSQINNRMLETVTDENHKTHSLIYNSNKALVAELHADLRSAIDKFKMKSEQQKNKWDGVYALSLALIEMTKEQKI
jgi:DNA-binding MarR family transcriptional regulator